MSRKVSSKPVEDFRPYIPTPHEGEILLSRPAVTGFEAGAVADAIARNTMSGGGYYCRRCEEKISAATGQHAMLTPSCTSALEFAAVLAGLRPGDEVIMPSFTFSSTANAFVLAGATPVFVDVREDTLNIDERLIEAAVTSRTRAIVPVHYAGIPAEMDTIMATAKKHDLFVIEDAAQAYGSTYRGRPAGALGDMAAFSFHATKNLHCGEGGALIVDSARFAERGEIVREKGTNRSKFIRGEVDKYTWVDAGSSYLISEVSAAYLEQQLLHADEINADRLVSWGRYHAGFEMLEELGRLRRPVVPAHIRGNAHIYYLLLDSTEARNKMQMALRARKIQALSHYEPLHRAEAGLKYCRTPDVLSVTDSISGRLLRLPLYYKMGNAVDVVVEAIQHAMESMT